MLLSICADEMHTNTSTQHANTAISKNIAEDRPHRCKLGAEGHPGQAASRSHRFTMLPSCGEKQ